MKNSILDLVSGTENGIVSKILMKGSGGNVSLFAFDKDQSLEKHSTPRKALILILEGKSSFSCKGEKVILEKDDYYLIEENEEHSIEAITPFKMLLILLQT